MNRLTERIGNSIKINNATVSLYYEFPLKKEVMKLTEYEDLEEQGLLIKLPCKVGDYVYEANKSRNIISTYKITAIAIGRDSRNYNWGLLDGVYSNMNGFNEFALGKTVFTTREEAEKALKELEEENE